MREKTVTGSVTLTDRDMKDTIIKCNSSSLITLTFPATSAKHIAADSIIVNYGAGDVTAAGTVISQGKFAQISTDGSTWYVYINSSLALGETSATAYRGDRGKTAYDHSQAAHAPSNAQKNSDILKSEIEAVLTGEISTHTHATIYYEPLVNGDSTSPEVMFDDDGDIIMVEV